MTRTEWLTNQHRRIDATITTLESQTPSLWCESHRLLLQDLKKQRLKIKSELATVIEDAITTV